MDFLANYGESLGVNDSMDLYSTFHAPANTPSCACDLFPPSGTLAFAPADYGDVGLSKNEDYLLCNAGDPVYQDVLEHCKQDNLPAIDLDVFADRGLTGMDWYLSVTKNFGEFYTVEKCLDQRIRTDYITGLLWLVMHHPAMFIVHDHSLVWLHRLQDISIKVIQDKGECMCSHLGLVGGFGEDQGEEVLRLDEKGCEEHIEGHMKEFTEKHESAEVPLNDNNEAESDDGHDDIDIHLPRCLYCLEHKRWCSRTDGKTKCHRCGPDDACTPEPTRRWKNGKPPTYGTKKKRDPKKANTSH